MAVRSKRLWSPTTVSTANVILYTAPANETALVKCISIVNIAAIGATTVLLRINGTGGAQAFISRSVPNAGDIQVAEFIVLNPGDVLRAQAGQASLVITGFGAELEGAAD